MPRQTTRHRHPSKVGSLALGLTTILAVTATTTACGLEATNRTLHPQRELAPEEHGPATLACTNAEDAWLTRLNLWLIPFIVGAVGLLIVWKR